MTPLTARHCLHRTCVPSILDVTTNILHIGCRGCFVFVSLWLHSLFFFSSSSGELCHRRTMFSLSIKWWLDKVWRKHLSLCPNTVMSAGEQQLLRWLKVITSYFLEHVAGVIYNLLTYCSRLLCGGIASPWGKFNNFSSHHSSRERCLKRLFGLSREENPFWFLAEPFLKGYTWRALPRTQHKGLYM